MRTQGARAEPDWPELPSRVAALIELGRRFDPDPEHAAQVTRLSCGLFDQLRSNHGLGDQERELLLAGAVLHDIGWHLGASKHHKSSARLIEEASVTRQGPLSGFTERERAIIAALARYHRKALPRRRHRRFAALKPADRDLVRKLAAIMRVADGLDRTHCSVVTDVRVKPEGDGFRLQVVAADHAQSEIWAATKKADLFEKVYGPLRMEVVTTGQS